MSQRTDAHLGGSFRRMARTRSASDWWFDTPSPCGSYRAPRAASTIVLAVSRRQTRGAIQQGPRLCAARGRSRQERESRQPNISRDGP
jgi:hypothetical protein